MFIRTVPVQMHPRLDVCLVPLHRHFHGSPPREPVVSQQGEYCEVSVLRRDAARVPRVHLFDSIHAEHESEVSRVRPLRAREGHEFVQAQVYLGEHEAHTHLGLCVYV